MLVTKMAETVTNIIKLSSTQFVFNIRHQHRCSQSKRQVLKPFDDHFNLTVILLVMIHIFIPKKDLRQNVMKNSTGAMYVMNMARKWLEVVKMQPQFVSIFVCRSCLKMDWFSFEGCDSRLRKLKLVQKDVLQRWTVA